MDVCKLSNFKIANTFTNHNSSVIPPLPVVKADSGASRHYFRPEDSHVLKNLNTQPGPTVQLPDNSTLSSTKCGSLPIPTLSTNAKRTYVLKNLKNASLLSLGQLCDDDCIVQLRKPDMQVFKDGNIILKGIRNSEDGLWDVVWETKPTQTQKANIVVQRQSLPELIAFYHGCAFSPTKQTWLQAIKNGNFVTWPGLSYDRASKYFPTTIATPMGHLDQEQKNIQSTIHLIPLTAEEEKNMMMDRFPLQDTTSPTHNVMCALIPFILPAKGYMDLTGRFPYRSSSGNQYIMVFYNYDGNFINAKPVKSRQAAHLKNAFIAHTEEMKVSGIHPKIYILDNEISTELRNALKKYDLQYQLVPPHLHRRNAAERAIRTFKNHFIAGLASVNPSFPISEWYRLLPQAIITLNLLRNARLNPKLSAYAYAKGVHDYNVHPLAPPGTHMIAHEKSTQRKSWDKHGKSAWYVGPALDHYRCVRAFIPETGDERVCDTLKYLPHNIPFPKATTEDYLIQAAQDIVTLLKQKATIPLPHHPNNTLNDAITSTATLLQRAATIPPPQAPIKNPVPPLQNISKNVNKPTPAPHEPSPRVSPAPNVIPDVPPSPRVLPH